MATTNNRNTKAKEDVLRILQDSTFALSHTDIEEKAAVNFDRVTLYRILSSYEQQGIVHKIVDASGKARYASCKNDCHKEHHKHDNHLHFGCTSCGKMYCFDNKIIDLRMPKGFKVAQFNYAVYGTCEACN